MCPNEIWREHYFTAILESDKEKVLLRIHAAKMAMCDRVEELNGGGSASERVALNDAMKALSARAYSTSECHPMCDAGCQ